ncbi:MAG: 50S ribosomal protein L30 [Clostridia bacterium]|jgi:large subunit ribosomal protein L30|nr:50S ribosomal protein L30 [Oscillospiraceae bacterium]MBQ4048167.1 50S ribosomal protein L30 [Clostridia bacterium]MBR7137426.1 50S ribosomal protein L30 [Clostridia bacterium]
MSIKVTLVKSLNGRNDKHIATAHSLGLRKIDDSTIQPDNAATQGKVAQISYLVKVENV